MNLSFEHTAEQAVAFQKIWTDSATKIMQAAFTAAPDSTPPELLRQIRSGIFAALAQSWDQFMRSPEFLENMRQWMENAINFRKVTNDFLGKLRNEMQAPSREDVDTIMLAIRHMEKRLLDCTEELRTQVREINQRLDALSGGPTRIGRPTASRQRRGAARVSSPRRKASKTSATSRKLGRHPPLV